MSLKNECIDMIRLIADSMGTDYEYDLEIDSYRDICELKGEDVTYSGCIYCENEGDCKYLKHIKVDVSFWDYADFQKNYIFSNKGEKQKGVEYIYNRKQLLEVMKDVKKEVEFYKDYNSEFGDMYDQFMEYAKEFTEQLKKDHGIFSLVNSDILPIVLHKGYGKDKSGKLDLKRAGDVQRSGLQTVINVYCSIDDIEETKQSLRHELIHYCLYMCGMKFGDEDAIFHYLCNEYDAYAYKEMPEHEQQLYDKLQSAIDNMKMINDFVGSAEDERKNIREAMIVAIGNRQENNFDIKMIDKSYEIMKIFGLNGEKLLSIYSNIDTDKQRNLIA